MMIETKIYGRWVNSDDIVEMRDVKSDKPGGACVARLRDGSKAEFHGFSAEVVDQLAPLLPAEPGYVSLTYYHNGKEKSSFVHRQPVLGWRVLKYGPEPVVHDSSDECHGLLYPDGRVSCPPDATFDNEANWLSYMAEQAQDKEDRMIKAIVEAG